MWKQTLTLLVGWYDLFNSTINTNRQYPGLGTVKKFLDKKILKFRDIFQGIKATQIHWKSVITVICQYKYNIRKCNLTWWPLPCVPHIQLVTYRCSQKIHDNCKKLDISKISEYFTTFKISGISDNAQGPAYIAQGPGYIVP